MSDPSSSSGANTLATAHRTSSHPRDDPSRGSHEARDSSESRDSRSLPRPSPRHPSRSPDPGRAGGHQDDRFVAAIQQEESPERSSRTRGAVLPNGFKPKGCKTEKYEMRSNTALQEDSDEDDDDWC